MTTQEREVLTSAKDKLDWTNYCAPIADTFKAQLHSQDALDEFELHISRCYHIEEYTEGMI